VRVKFRLVGIAGWNLLAKRLQNHLLLQEKNGRDMRDNCHYSVLRIAELGKHGIISVLQQ
jgi:hypothetical protein